MKKLIIAFILIMVLFYAHSLNTNFTLKNYFKGTYTSYSNVETKNSTNLGFCYLNTSVDIPQKHLIGESIILENIELNSALTSLKAKVVKTECLENCLVVIYAYTPLIKCNVNINNKKVNLQIAHKNEKTIIGWPLILGSF